MTELDMLACNGEQVVSGPLSIAQNEGIPARTMPGWQLIPIRTEIHNTKLE